MLCVRESGGEELERLTIGRRRRGRRLWPARNPGNLKARAKVCAWGSDLADAPSFRYHLCEHVILDVVAPINGRLAG